jgi:hypothetical protein
MQSTRDNDDSLCKLVHNLINKLAVILGCCELLTDEAKEGSECAKRLATIRDTVEAMTRELKRTHCRPPEGAAIQISSWIKRPIAD